MTHRSLILGANGQDGQIMINLLLLRGHEVWGLGRQSAHCQEINTDKFNYIQIDLADQDLFQLILGKIRPTNIIHLAAIHGSSQNNTYEPFFSKMLDVNVKTVHSILEYQRSNPNSQLIYASSGKVYGSPLPKLVSEKTPKKALCLYGISKISAGNLIEYYRKNYKIKASIYYLFNHESNLRTQDFFISKVVVTLKKSIEDRSYKTEFHSLNFYCDWGSASEYMLLMLNAAESKPKLDMIIASGKTIYARKLVAELFDKNGLDFKNHITEKFQIENPHFFQVDISRLIKTVGSPKIEIAEVVKGMI